MSAACSADSSGSSRYRTAARRSRDAVIELGPVLGVVARPQPRRGVQLHIRRLEVRGDDELVAADARSRRCRTRPRRGPRSHGAPPRAASPASTPPPATSDASSGQRLVSLHADTPSCAAGGPAIATERPSGVGSLHCTRWRPASSPRPGARTASVVSAGYAPAAPVAGRARERPPSSPSRRPRTPATVGQRMHALQHSLPAAPAGPRLVFFEVSRRRRPRAASGGRGAGAPVLMAQELDGRPGRGEVRPARPATP